VASAAESGRTTEVLSKAVKIRRLNNMQVKRRDVDSKRMKMNGTPFLFHPSRTKAMKTFVFQTNSRGP
jgi:hypothetical protein